jgi:hypothetical protein
VLKAAGSGPPDVVAVPSAGCENALYGIIRSLAALDHSM